MAGRADIKAGEGYVRLFLKDDMTKALQKSLTNVGKTLQSTGKQVALVGAGISAAGAAILTPLTGAITHFLNVSDDLTDMSARTGVATDALAELGFAASQSGTDIASVETSLLKMTRTLGDAATGSKSARAAFESLGLSVENLQAMTPDQQFQAVADALGNIGDPAERMSRLVDIFGKGSAAILPMLENLRALREESRKEGLIPSKEATAAGAKLKDEFVKLIAVVGSLAFEIGASLAEEVQTFIDIARETIKTVRDWIKENRGLVKIAAAVGIGLAALGAVITTVGGAMIALGLAATGLSVAVGAIASVFAFLATPIGIVLASVVAITAALTAGVIWWAKFTDAGKAAVKIVSDVFGGIFDALKAGKWMLAGDIAMAALRLAWVKGTNALEAIWDNLMDNMADAFFAVIDELRDAWNAVFSEVMPIAGGGGDRAPRSSARDDARKKREADQRHILDTLIAAAGAGVADGGVVIGKGGGVGGGGMIGNKPSGVSQWFRGNQQNVITNSGLAAAAAGYGGSVRNTADPATRALMKIEKAVMDSLKKQDDMRRAVERIAEGLHH